MKQFSKNRTIAHFRKIEQKNGFGLYAPKVLNCSKNEVFLRNTSESRLFGSLNVIITTNSSFPNIALKSYHLNFSAKIETPDLFEAERKHESENEDSLDDLSSSDDEASKPQKNKNIKVKRMDVKHGIKLSSMYDSSKLNTLNDQRKVEEEMPLGKRISTTQHDEVRHVRGGKIFQIHSKKSTKCKFLTISLKILTPLPGFHLIMISS